MSSARLVDLLDVAVRTAESARATTPAAGRLLAIGWTTVDLERAIVELAHGMDRPVEAFEAVAGSAILGARCRLVRSALAADRSLLVCEPTTEGRLAASLARSGEGPAIAWYERIVPIDEGEDASGDPDSRAQPGPLGLERLDPEATASGPFRFVVDTRRVPSTS